MTTAQDHPDLTAELVAVRRTLARLEKAAGLASPEPRATTPVGFRLVNPGDVIQADDHNLVMTQTMAVFASAAARAAAITAPVEGMHSYLKDVDRVEIYTGTVWQPWASPITAQAVATTLDGARSGLLWASRSGPVIVVQFKVSGQSGAVGTVVDATARPAGDISFVAPTYTSGGAGNNTYFPGRMRASGQIFLDAGGPNPAGGNIWGSVTYVAGAQGG